MKIENINNQSEQITLILIMELLPLEIWTAIFDQCDVISQIRFRQVCRYFYNGIQITDFYHIDGILRNKLNDGILRNYLHLKYLNAWNNPKIININHLTHLKILKICGGLWNKGRRDQRP